MTGSGIAQGVVRSVQVIALALIVATAISLSWWRILVIVGAAIFMAAAHGVERWHQGILAGPDERSPQ